MKRLSHALFAVLLLFSASLFAQSTDVTQIADKSIGLHVFVGIPSGVQADVQTKVSEKNLLDFKIGLGSLSDYKSLKISGNYLFVFPFDAGFNFYAGPGISTGYWNAKVNNETKTEQGMFLNLTADAGAQYLFRFPLQISFDIVPEAGVIHDMYRYAFTGGITFSYYIDKNKHQTN